MSEPKNRRLDDPAVDWSLGTWEGSRREQLRRWSRLSLDEILRAQEEMAQLADWLTTPRGDADAPPSETAP